MKNFLSSMKLQGSKGRFYRKSLIIILIVTSLPTALIAISTYFVGVRRIEREINSTHQQQLNHIYKSMDTQFSSLEISVNQWAFNPIFDDRLKDMDLRREFVTTQDLGKMTLIQQNSSPLIYDVNLYLDYQGMLISGNGEVITLKDEPEKQLYHSLLSRNQTFFWDEEIARYKRQEGALPVSLVQKVPAGKINVYGAIVLRLSRQQIANTLAQLNPDGKGASFIIKQDGQWLANDKSAAPGESPLENIIRREVAGRTAPGESFTFKYNRENYAVTYGTFSKTGWKYIIATPLSVLTASLALTSRLVLGISVLGLLTAFLLSWLASRKMYKPIHYLVNLFNSGDTAKSNLQGKDEIQFIENQWTRLNRESKQLQERLEQNLVYLKQGYFLQLVQGHLYYLTEQELKMQMEQYGWCADNRHFVILMIQLIYNYELNGRFSRGDEQLITFAAVNIVEEMLENRFEPFEAMNFHDLSVALLFSFPDDKREVQLKNELIQASDTVMEGLTKYLGVDASVGLSRVTNSVRELPRVLEEVRQIFRYRDVAGKNQIIDVCDILPGVNHVVDYPFEIEKEIIQAVKMGAEAAAEMKIREFSGFLKLHGGKEFLFRDGMLQLLGSILHAVRQSGINPYAVYEDGVNLYEQMARIHDLDEMLEWLINKVVQPYMKELREAQTLQLRQLIEKVMETVNREYMRDISLEACAEMHGTYAEKVSVGFKQITGKNFIDYITELRLEKSKELLRDTDVKMNDIAEKVGYQPTYFNKIFKRHEGMTPGQYRELHRPRF